MKKELFADIFGSDFTITNYKVNTPKELVEVLSIQESELLNRVFDFDERDCPITYKFREGSNIDDIGMVKLIEEYLTIQFYTKFGNTRDYYKRLTQRLKFMVTQNSKMELLQKDLKSLEKDFCNNPYNDILTPDNYFNEIRSQTFIENLWSKYQYLNTPTSNNFKRNYGNPAYDITDLMDHEDEDGSFTHLFEILKKFTLIYYQISLLNNTQDVEEIVNSENKFPSIFVDSYSMELFNYLIEKEEGSIGAAYVDHYFMLFKDEEFIKRNAEPGNFLRFLKTIHQLDFKKLDKRTGYSDKHKENLVDLKNTFKTKAHVK